MNPNDYLYKYTPDQLKDALTTRRNKTSYSSNIPEDLKNASDQQIVDVLRLKEKAIYGVDRRKEYYDFATLNPAYVRAADAVVALIPPQNYDIHGARFKISAGSLASVGKVCSSEPYSWEPAAAYCTGFMIAPDLIATAGHCVRSDWRSTRLVFGYRIAQNGSNLDDINFGDVYSPIEIVDQGNGPNDFAVMRVDHTIRGHSALPLSKKPPLQNDGVYTLGFPSDVPIKLAADASVRSIINGQGYFVSNLDTFAGNSGSPVINAGSQEVEGILVRGENDWRTVNGCQVALVCPTTGCSGEEATLISVVEPSLTHAGASIQKREALLPITKEFTSQPELSGSKASSSQEYILLSDPPPTGYKIGSYTPALTGDRICNRWSTCKAAIEGDHVVMRFTLQGHDEWPGSGQALSVGHLTVTYVPVT